MRVPSQDAATPDMQRLASLQQIDIDAVATTKTKGDPTVVMSGGRRHHMNELRLVGGHRGEVRQAA